MAQLSAGADSIARRIASVVRITQILDRNRSDSDFAAEDGNEIVYVLDTNVVQSFLEPYANPHFGELFHNSDFGSAVPKAVSFNGQACMLACEYLLTGALPGQRKGLWYMSPEHHEETLLQLDFFRDKIGERRSEYSSDPTAQEAFHRYAAEIDMLLGLEPDGNLPEFRQLALSDQVSAPYLLDRLKGDQPGPYCEVIRNLALNHALASERLLEPVEQFNRFLREGIAARVRNMQTRFILPAELREELASDTKWWRGEIQTEFEDRGLRHKSNDAIRADASTLAQVGLISRHLLKENERIVFVTGDATLLRLYRRWFSERKKHHHFTLRPISHFAPALNLHDAEGAVAAEAKDHSFARLHGAVEASLTAMNLAFYGDSGSPEAMTIDFSRARARDFFVSQMEADPENGRVMLTVLFPEFDDEDWVEDQVGKLDEAISAMQVVERITTGSFPQLLGHRLSAEKREALAALRDPVAGPDAISTFLAERLDQAMLQGFKFSVPMMPGKIAELLDELERRDRDSQEVARASVTVGLTFPTTDGRELDQHDVMSALGSGADGLAIVERLLDDPELLFALTGLLAFRLELWADAARAARFAADANAVASAVGENDRRNELLYMRAVAQRFRLADTEDDAQRRTEPVWDQCLAAAVAALTETIASHAKNGTAAEQVRDLSELAAVKLSYAEWFAYPRASRRETSDLPAGAVLVLREAIQHLSECRALHGALAAADTRSMQPRHRRMLDNADRQSMTNQWAAMLCARAMERIPGAERVEIPWSRTMPAEFPYVDPPRVSSAYFHAASGNADAFAKISLRQISLKLDREVIRFWRDDARSGLSAGRRT